MPNHSLTKLLIVDDDLDILSIVKYSLENMSGVIIKTASSGEEAIREAMNFKPDLMLLDAIMPQMDGVTTLKTMRTIPSLAQIPVIFFTAKVQKNEIASFIKEGAIDVIVKPFDPLTLAQTIQAIWEKYTHGR